MLEMFGSTLRLRQITLHLDLGQVPPLPVPAPSLELERLLLRALSSGIEKTPRGGALRVSTVQNGPDHAQLRVQTLAGGRLVGKGLVCSLSLQKSPEPKAWARFVLALPTLTIAGFLSP